MSRKSSQEKDMSELKQYINAVLTADRRFYKVEQRVNQEIWATRKPHEHEPGAFIDLAVPFHGKSYAATQILYQESPKGVDLKIKIYLAAKNNWEPIFAGTVSKTEQFLRILSMTIGLK